MRVHSIQYYPWGHVVSMVLLELPWTDLVVGGGVAWAVVHTHPPRETHGGRRVTYNGTPQGLVLCWHSLSPSRAAVLLRTGAATSFGTGRGGTRDQNAGARVGGETHRAGQPWSPRRSCSAFPGARCCTPPPHLAANGCSREQARTLPRCCCSPCGGTEGRIIGTQNTGSPGTLALTLALLAERRAQDEDIGPGGGRDTGRARST